MVGIALRIRRLVKLPFERRWSKATGLVLMLLATWGFGFHDWHLNNKIDACRGFIDDRVEARKRYIDGVMRYRDLKQQWQVELLSEGMAQLFKRSDLTLFKKPGDINIKSVYMARKNIRHTKRIALTEFSYNVGGKTFSDQILQEFDSLGNPENPTLEYMDEIHQKTEELYQHIVSRLSDTLETLQKELEEKRSQELSYSACRRWWHIFYMTIQVIGIAFTIRGELPTKKET